MEGPATRNGQDVGRALDWMFRPFGLAGSHLATPVAGLFASAMVLVFCLDIATPPSDVLIVFALPPLLAAMWLLPGRLARLVGLVGAAVFVGAPITEVSGRATELSIAMVALAMAAAARWYAGQVSELMYAQSRSALPLQVGEWSAGLRLLTRRELEIARLASTGYSAREISKVLHISERTVENHIANVYAKLGINSRRALIKMAAVFTNR